MRKNLLILLALAAATCAAPLFAADSSKIYAKISTSNQSQWGQNYTLEIHNESSAPITDWVVRIPIKGSADSITSVWECKSSKGGGFLTLSADPSKAYTLKVGANSVMSGPGFWAGLNAVDTSKVTLTYKKADGSAGSSGTAAAPAAKGSFSYSASNPGNNRYGQNYQFAIKNTGSAEISSWTLTIPILNSKYPNGGEQTPSVWGTNASISRSGSNIVISSSVKIPAGGQDNSAGIWALFNSLDFARASLTLNSNSAGTNAGNSGSQGANSGSSGTSAGASSSPIAVPAVSGGSFKEHGKLKVSGTHLQDKNGRNFILRGVSTHGINWDCGYPFVKKEAFQNLRDEWGVNAVRLAMYTVEYNGYCSGGNQAELKRIIADGVQYATELGMYAIIDWHVLNDCNPQRYKNEAKAFFTEMASKYAKYDNVLYEICNEPNGGTSWADIKAYAEEVIPVIRKYAKDAIIIVGTPTWSQDVDIASQNKISSANSRNVMYTIHFYSGTHKDSYRAKVQAALNNGLPVFCTEFGVSYADGNGGVFKDEAVKWLDFFDKNGISYFCWAFANKDETSNLIRGGQVGWTSQYRSEAGRWIVEQYNKRNAK